MSEEDAVTRFADNEQAEHGNAPTSGPRRLIPGDASRTVAPESPPKDVVTPHGTQSYQESPSPRRRQDRRYYTRTNLLHAMASFAQEVALCSAKDTVIREQLLAELKTQPWAPFSVIDIVVRNGVVQSSGTITDERQRQALRVAAENIPAVKKVED